MTGCAFCGRALVRKDYLASDELPELIIPFRLTPDEAKELLLAWCNRNAGKREAVKRFLELLHLLFKLLEIGQTLEDMLAIKVAQLDLRNVFRLLLVDAEADHQVRNDFALLLGLAHNLDGLVNIQQNLFQTGQQVQFFFRFQPSY